MRRKQAKSYEDDKSEAAMKNSNTAMLQVDFAEITHVLLKMKSNQHIGNRIKSHYSPQLCGLAKTLNVK